MFTQPATALQSGSTDFFNRSNFVTIAIDELQRHNMPMVSELAESAI
jgi:hypothetical protein